MSYSLLGLQGGSGGLLGAQNGLLGQDMNPWQAALLGASQALARGVGQQGGNWAGVLSGALSGGASGLLQGQASERRQQKLDQALEGIPEAERQAYKLMTPTQLGEALQKRQQRKADYDALQAIPGLGGLLGGGAPAGQDAFAQQPVATPDAAAPAGLPAALPVGRTAYAMTPQTLQAQAQAESGGNPTAKNPRSSALGTQQFTNGTWQQFIQENPSVFQGMSPEQAMSMRSDPRYADLGAQWYAQKGGEVLQQAGLPVTQTNLALHHRFGPEDAPKVIAADPATPMGQLVSPAVMNANPDLQGKTAGQVRGTYAMRYGTGEAGGAPATVATPTTSAQGAPINPNTILRVAQAAAQGNEAAKSLLPVLQSLSKQDMKTTTIAPGGTVVRQNPDGTVTEIYRSPDREDNQLVPVVGPDGKPVLMRRAQAEGQVPFSAPQVAIDQRGQSTYDQERGKTAATAIGTIESQAAAAPGTLRQLDQLERASQGFQTGAGAGARMTVGKIAQALGIKDDALPAGLNKDAIASGEQIQSVTGQLVMSQIGSGGFPANNFSDADRAFLERIQPGIERTPQGNRILIGVLRANAQRNAEIGQAWRDWRKQHGDNLASVQEFQATKLPEITGRDILAPMFQDAIPTEQQTAPGQVQADPPPRAQPAAQVPSRPPALPAGSQYSPSRGQWRDPSGRIYDREGRPVQ